MCRAHNLLEVRNRVPLRIPPRRRARREVHIHPRGRVRVRQRVLTRAPVQTVRAGSALHNVVAPTAGERVRPRTAPQPVGMAVPGQRVVVRRAHNVLELVQPVALGVPTLPPARHEVRVHPLGRARVRQRVLTSSAVHSVRTGAAFQHVVASTAIQPVGACPSVQVVVTPAAVHPVVPRPSGQSIGTAVTPEGVTMRRAHHVLEVRNRVPLRIPARNRTGREVHAHPRTRIHVRQRVLASTNVQTVPAGSAL